MSFLPRLTRLSLSSGNLMKPSLDLLLFTSQLARSLGFRGTVLLFINYYVTAKVCRLLYLRNYINIQLDPPRRNTCIWSSRSCRSPSGRRIQSWCRTHRERERRNCVSAHPVVSHACHLSSDRHQHRFYNGGARERDILTRAYLRLIKHVNSIYKVCSSLLPPSIILSPLGLS